MRTSLIALRPSEKSGRGCCCGNGLGRSVSCVGIRDGVVVGVEVAPDDDDDDVDAPASAVVPEADDATLSAALGNVRAFLWKADGITSTSGDEIGGYGNQRVNSSRIACYGIQKSNGSEEDSCSSLARRPIYPTATHVISRRESGATRWSSRRDEAAGPCRTFWCLCRCARVRPRLWPRPRPAPVRIVCTLAPRTHHLPIRQADAAVLSANRTPVIQPKGATDFPTFLIVFQPDDTTTTITRALTITIESST